MSAPQRASEAPGRQLGQEFAAGLDMVTARLPASSASTRSIHIGSDWQRNYEAECAQWVAGRKQLERHDKRSLFILGVVATLLFGGFVWVVLLGVERKYAQFMRECTQEHKHYECVAMWRPGEPSTVPVVIPVPFPHGK